MSTSEVRVGYGNDPATGRTVPWVRWRWPTDAPPPFNDPFCVLREWKIGPTVVRITGVPRETSTGWQVPVYDGWGGCEVRCVNLRPVETERCAAKGGYLICSLNSGHAGYHEDRSGHNVVTWTDRTERCEHDAATDGGGFVQCTTCGATPPAAAGEETDKDRCRARYPNRSVMRQCIKPAGHEGLHHMLGSGGAFDVFDEDIREEGDWLGDTATPSSEAP